MTPACVSRGRCGSCPAAACSCRCSVSIERNSWATGSMRPVLAACSLPSLSQSLTVGTQRVRGVALALGVVAQSDARHRSTRAAAGGASRRLHDSRFDGAGRAGRRWQTGRTDRASYQRDRVDRSHDRVAVSAPSRSHAAHELWHGVLATERGSGRSRRAGSECRRRRSSAR